MKYENKIALVTGSSRGLGRNIADGGRIVNLSTGLARFSVPGYAAYASMKGAIEVPSRYLAKELGARKISVNVVAPGSRKAGASRSSRCSTRSLRISSISRCRPSRPTGT